MQTLGKLCLLFASAPAFAQTTVIVPTTFANAPASSSTAYPLGSSTPCRAQYIYDPAELGFAAPATLKSLEVRALQSGVYAAKTLTLQIEMSTTSALPSAPSATFATNRGTNHIVVFNSKSVNLPATTSGFLGTWSGAMLFDTPFTYDPAAGNLLVEFDVSAIGATAWSQNVTFTAAGTHFTVGTACGAFAGTSSGGGINATLTYSASAGAPNAPAAFILGASELPVPIPLPGNPGCTVNETLDVTVPVTLTATGTGSQVFTVPNVPLYRGVSLWGQWVELNASNLLDSTVARRAVLQGVHAVGRCYSASSNTATSGTSQAAVGLILRLGL